MDMPQNCFLFCINVQNSVYYRVHTEPGKTEKPGDRAFLQKVKENLDWSIQGIFYAIIQVRE